MANFWYNPGLQPKRQYRWLMYIGGMPQWIIKKVNKPSFTIKEASHAYLNHTFYFPGRIEYEKTSITLVDPLSPDASAIMMKILADSGYAIPTRPNVTNTISKAGAVGALGNVLISQIDAAGDPVDQFTFINAWMTSVKFGELDYESDALVDLTMELRYDFVVMPQYGGKKGGDGSDLDKYVGGKKKFASAYGKKGKGTFGGTAGAAVGAATGVGAGGAVGTDK